MKKVFAWILTFCLCIGLCACGDSEEKATIPTTEPPIIESGMKIDTLFGVFSAPEEDYQEKVLCSTRTEFSFRNDKVITQGLLCGDDVIEFSWTFPDIYAETYEEFGELVEFSKTEYSRFSEEQKSSFQIVLFTAAGAYLLDGDTSLTMGDVVSAIVDGSEHKTVDWIWQVELNTDDHTAVFHAQYRN